TRDRRHRTHRPRGGGEGAGVRHDGGVRAASGRALARTGRPHARRSARHLRRHFTPRAGLRDHAPHDRPEGVRPDEAIGVPDQHRARIRRRRGRARVGPRRAADRRRCARRVREGACGASRPDAIRQRRARAASRQRDARDAARDGGAGRSQRARRPRGRRAPDADRMMSRRAPVAAVMRKLAKAIDGLDEPAVEKIAKDQREDPFHVLIATMLSAQTRDTVTAEASRRLFRVARTPRSMARLTHGRIRRLIYPVSFYRNKAVHVKETCRQILDRFGGRVPSTMDELLTLPGVGRKTANLVLILAHSSEDNICVDTHVHRISNRLGWVRTKTPDETEHALYRAVARRWWPLVNLYLVTWGQNVCRPVYPLCPQCVLADVCPKIGVTKVGRTEAGGRKTG